MAAIQFSSTEYDRKHIKGLAKRQRALGVLFEDFYKQVAVIGSLIDDEDINLGVKLHIDHYPYVERSLKRLMMQLASDIATTVKDGNMAAWEVSEQKNKALMKRVGHSVTLPKEITKNVRQSSETALEEFCNRKENGMNLSTRVWNLVKPLTQVLHFRKFFIIFQLSFRFNYLIYNSDILKNENVVHRSLRKKLYLCSHAFHIRDKIQPKSPM